MTEPITPERLAQIRSCQPPPFDDVATQIVYGTIQELLAEIDRCHGILNGLQEEFALYHAPKVSANPAERWTGPGANGAAEAAAWNLRAIFGDDVTVVRRIRTGWSLATTNNQASTEASSK